MALEETFSYLVGLRVKEWRTSCRTFFWRLPEWFDSRFPWRGFASWQGELPTSVDFSDQEARSVDE